ncbi:unnamed protein product [Eretmochelys imbricata]
MLGCRFLLIIIRPGICMVHIKSSAFFRWVAGGHGTGGMPHFSFFGWRSWGCWGWPRPAQGCSGWLRAVAAGQHDLGQPGLAWGGWVGLGPAQCSGRLASVAWVTRTGASGAVPGLGWLRPGWDWGGWVQPGVGPVGRHGWGCSCWTGWGWPVSRVSPPVRLGLAWGLGWLAGVARAGPGWPVLLRWWEGVGLGVPATGGTLVWKGWGRGGLASPKAM